MYFTFRFVSLLVSHLLLLLLLLLFSLHLFILRYFFISFVSVITLIIFSVQQSFFFLLPGSTKEWKNCQALCTLSTVTWAKAIFWMRADKTTKCIRIWRTQWHNENASTSFYNAPIGFVYQHNAMKSMLVAPLK